MLHFFRVPTEATRVFVLKSASSQSGRRATFHRPTEIASDLSVSLTLAERPCGGTPGILHPMSLRAQRSIGVASIVVAALAYRQLLFWNPGSIRLPPFQAWLVLPSGTSPQLILALVAALLYRKRERLRLAVQAHGPPALAILPLLGGFSLFIWGHYVEASDLILVSFVSM
jgi:hypothetical protein